MSNTEAELFVEPECDHDWRWVHDWDGDPEVIGGTQPYHFRRCKKCGGEDNKTIYRGEDDD